MNKAIVEDSRPHIVVVDDEPQVLAAVEDQLDEHFVVHAAASGQAALELLREFKQASVLLSDQRMPGMTGDELFQRASEISDATRVLITGFADLDAVIRAVNRGKVFGYITKPWDRGELHLMLHKADEHHKLVRALQHERDLLHNLMENVPDLITFKDLEGRMIRVNKAYARFRGLRDAADLAGRLNSEFLPPEFANTIRAEDTEVIRTKRPLEVESAEQGPDGQAVWLSKTKAPVLDKAGNVTSVVAIARDVTARKEQEQRIARLTRIQAMLSGINTTIVRVTSEGELFKEACRLAVETGGFALANIRLLDQAEANLVSTAWAGTGLNVKPIPVGEAADAEMRATTNYAAFRERRTVVCNDLRTDPLQSAYRRQSIAQGIRSAASLPLVVDEKTVGVISFLSTEANFFDAEEIRLLEELAGDVAFAIDTLHNRDRLYYLALHDPLTGLGNRAMLQEKLGDLIEAVRGRGESFGVVSVNLRRFRAINETLGLHVGDELLKQTAARLAKAVGKEHVTRLNADVFLLILEQAGEANAAAREVTAIRRALAPVYPLAGRELHVDARFGLALYPGDGEQAGTLIANAETALQKGRGVDDTMTFYTPEINARVAERLDLESRLRRALEERQFVLHYQPKVDAGSGAIVAAEALLRWNDPKQGLVAPGRFIPVLEETGLIVEVGRWALEEAARVQQRVAAAGVARPRVSVNVSPVQMRRPDFPREVVDAVCTVDENHGIDLEITESQLMENLEGVVRKLGMLRAAGFDIAVDDFGTGYSSLGYLARLPIDALKIDRSFISAMTGDANNTAIVSTIINLAHTFKLRVIAEGVETEEQLKLLRLLRCDEIQGYLFHKPMPEAQFLELLRQRAASGSTERPE